MFEIESVADRMVRIDDTYIPAVNIQIEGFPKTEHGSTYGKYFEVMFELEDHHWVVEEETYHPGSIFVTWFGPVGTIMDVNIFETWTAFKDHFLLCREDPYRGLALFNHIEHINGGK